MCLLTGVLRRSQLFEIQNLNQPGWGAIGVLHPKWVLAFKYGTASPQEELPGLVVCTPESIHTIRLQEINRVAEGMASLISWPSSGILTAGLAWSLDSDLFVQKSMTNRIGLAYLPATWRTAWRRSVHGQDAEEIQLEDDAEAHGLLEVQAPPEVAGSDADEPAGMEELDAGDLAGEVVAEHDPDAEPAGYVGVPAPLEEYKQSVMVWNYDQLSGGKEEVCSSSTKRRHLC